MAGLAAVTDAIAAALEPLQVEVEGLQLTAFMNANPTPPSIDVYPGGPSGTPAAQGFWEDLFTIRARISTPDDIAAQGVLLSLMDSSGPASVLSALEADRTLGGVVGGSWCEERSGFNAYSGPGGDWLGCEWQLRTIP